VDDSFPRTASWGGELVSALVDGDACDTVHAHLDDLLRWLASSAGEVAEIDTALLDRQIDHRWGRRMALMLLEEMLFSGSSSAPHQVLGLPSDCRSSELRPRYRLLMRVYHPDRSNGSSVWLTERAERINEAYARARGEDAPVKPSPTPRKVSRAPETRRVNRSRRRRGRPHGVRRFLGSPNAFRRRFLFGLVIASAAVVVYSCVSNSAWIGIAPAPASSGASLGLDLPLSREGLRP